MTFGEAIEALRNGHEVLRYGWNGKGMYLLLITEWQITGSPVETIEHYPLLPFIAIKTADNKLVPLLASQTDMLATDWMIYR